MSMDDYDKPNIRRLSLTGAEQRKKERKGTNDAIMERKKEKQEDLKKITEESSNNAKGVKV